MSSIDFVSGAPGRTRIVNFFRGRGIQIEPQAVEFLLDMVDNDTRTLGGTCEKLALFFGPGSRLGLAGSVPPDDPPRFEGPRREGRDRGRGTGV